MTLLFMSILIQIVGIGSQPYARGIDNAFLVFDEICVSSYLYILLAVTSNSGEGEIDIKSVRASLGWCLMATIFLSILVNLLKTLTLIVLACRQDRCRPPAKARPRPAPDLELQISIQHSNLDNDSNIKKKQSFTKKHPNNKKDGKPGKKKAKKDKKSGAISKRRPRIYTGKGMTPEAQESIKQ